MKYNIHLFDVAFNIINEYKELTIDSPYVFPILTNNHENKINTRIQSALKGLNSDIKKIAKELKIDKKVTSYTSRHTFATILKMAGESTEIISEILGHANTSTTQIYLNDFEEKTLKDSAEKAVNAVL